MFFNITTGARRRRRRAAGHEATTTDDSGPYTIDDIEFIVNPDDGTFSFVVPNKEDGTGKMMIMVYSGTCHYSS